MIVSLVQVDSEGRKTSVWSLSPPGMALSFDVWPKSFTCERACPRPRVQVAGFDGADHVAA